jgi:hypothetical protein
MATEIAKGGLPLHVHANLTATIDAFLDQIEAVNREYPVGRLRWALAHLNQVDASQLARLKTLGVAAAVHPWAVINGGIQPAGVRRRCGRYAAAADDSAERRGLGARQRRQPGESDPAVHDAVVGRHGQDGGRHDGAARDHRPQGRARRAHAPERPGSCFARTRSDRSSRASWPIWSCSIATT